MILFNKLKNNLLRSKDFLEVTVFMMAILCILDERMNK